MQKALTHNQEQSVKALAALTLRMLQVSDGPCLHCCPKESAHHHQASCHVMHHPAMHLHNRKFEWHCACRSSHSRSESPHHSQLRWGSPDAGIS